MSGYVSRIWRDQMPVLDAVATWITWNIYIWRVTTERDINIAQALFVLTLVALGIGVFVARNKVVSARLSSWITVPAVGSLICVLTVGLGVVVQVVTLADLILMQLVAGLFFFLIAMPAVLLFRISFFAFSYLFGHNPAHPQ